MGQTTTPGAALAVIKDGLIIYERGYGMAKLEDGIVMTPQKIFDIGSTSKQFTAACLAILIRQGKVGSKTTSASTFRRCGSTRSLSRSSTSSTIRADS